MPSLYNGIGTRYRNEKNVRTRVGKCMRCNFFGELKSYDAEKWFVIFLIPTYKIQSLHIFNYCPKCSVHSAMPTKEWEKRRIEAVSTTLIKYRENPRDGKAAVELLETADYFEDNETLTSAAKEIMEVLNNDPDVMTYMARMASLKKQTAESKRLYTRIIEIDPYNFNALSILMLHAVDANDAPEADKYATILFDNAAATYVPRIIQVVQLHQRLGQHRAALDMMDRIEVLSPITAQEKDFKNLRELSTTYEASGKPLKGVTFEFGRAEKERKRRNAIIAGMVIAGGVVCVYLGYCAMLGNRESLWMVNGLRTPYSVKIDGKEVQVSEEGGFPVRIGLGKHRIEPIADDVKFPPTEFTMEKPFITRPFSKTMFVSNPDTFGVVTLYTIHYAERRESTPGTDINLLRGKPFMEVANVDCPFREPPDTVSLSTGQRVAHRVVAYGGPYSILFSVGPEKMEAGQRIKLLRDLITLKNSESIYYFVAIAFPPSDMVTLLQDKYPGKFEDMRTMHYYYSALFAMGQADQTRAALDSEIIKDPTNPTILASRAMIEIDPVISLAFYKAAAESPTATDEIRASYAATLIRQNHAEEGLAIIKQFKNIPRVATREYYHELIKRGELETLQATVAEHEKLESDDVDGMLEAYLSEGGKEKVDLSVLHVGEDSENLIKPFITGNILLAEGKEKEAIAELTKSYWSKFEAALLSNNLKDAARLRNLSLGGMGYDDMLIYPAALIAKNSNLVISERANAIKYLRSKLHGGPVLADMIERKIPIDLDRAAALDISPELKALGFLIIALENPEMKDQSYAAIDRMDIGRTLPAPLIRKYMVK